MTNQRFPLFDSMRAIAALSVVAFHAAYFTGHVGREGSDQGFAQLNLGVWLPDWAGPAPWKTAKVSFASVKVWQFGDEGDVRNVLVDDIGDNFDKDGRPLR